MEVSYTFVSHATGPNTGPNTKQTGHKRLVYKLVHFVSNTIFPLRLRTWAHFEFHLFSFPSGIGPSNEGIWIVLRSIQHFPCSLRALGVSWGAHEDENTHRNHELLQRLCGTSYFTSSLLNQHRSHIFDLFFNNLWWDFAFMLEENCCLHYCLMRRSPLC